MAAGARPTLSAAARWVAADLGNDIRRVGVPAGLPGDAGRTAARAVGGSRPIRLGAFVRRGDLQRGSTAVHRSSFMSPDFVFSISTAAAGLGWLALIAAPVSGTKRSSQVAT